MLRIAVVEDNDGDYETLRGGLTRYAEEHGKQADVRRFSSALKFLDAYRSDFDVVFMDIELPDINGMDAAERLRCLDGCVALVFVTNLAQFAVRGYGVAAADFIVKPVNYYKLASLMSKLEFKIRLAREDVITLRTKGAVERVSLSDILYIEIDKHRMTFHTSTKDIVISDTLDNFSAKLPQDRFLRCYQSFIVNLKYVSSFGGDELTLSDGTVVPVSRARRKEVMRRVNEYFAKYEA